MGRNKGYLQLKIRDFERGKKFVGFVYEMKQAFCV